jgi:hypothetical protein
VGKERQETAMEDRDRIAALVGRKVAAGLKIAAGQSAEIVATLDEVRDDGIVLSEIGELGPGPTLFCPWDTLKRVRDRPPWLRMPHEVPVPEEVPQEQGFYELREATAEEVAPEPPVERRRASARNLDRVVPIGQRRTVGEVTLALTSLELFGEGVGVLRYRISYDEGMFYGIPEPELVIRDESDRELPWAPRGSSNSDNEADGEVEIRDLPEAGELEVEVTRLVSLAFDEEVVEESYEGSWTFSFSI